MDGVLIIDKPSDFTSFDVVAKLRGMLRTRKIGHAGTLDPMATGVLPLLLGMATKAADLLPDQRKRYTARFRLGLTTATQDTTGEVLERRPVDVSRAQVEEAILAMQGEILQTPPMYSALWVNGVRLYDLARQGVEVEREARPITIEEISLLCWDGDEYEIDVLCSKGTYIRTLCHDIGESLGCGAALTSLRRTMAAGYTLENALTMAQAQSLTNEDALAARILPVESLFAHLPRVELPEKRARLFYNGVRITLTEGEGRFAVLGPGGLLGVADTDAQGIVLTRKLFAQTL